MGFKQGTNNIITPSLGTTNINGGYLGYTNLTGGKDSYDFDVDAEAFFNAVEGGGDTLTVNEKLATNQLVLDFKSAGIWDLLDAFYPLVGSTITSQKWNLMDPRDLDEAFRLTFVNPSSFTFGPKGWKQDGLDEAGALTHYIPDVYGQVHNNSMGLTIWDLPTLGVSGNQDMGNYEPNDTKWLLNGGGFDENNNNTYATLGSPTFASKALTGNQGIATWILDSTNNINFNEMYRNGASWLSFSQSNILSPIQIALGAVIRNGVPFQGTDRGYSMFFIGKSLIIPGLITQFQTAVDRWRVSLGK